MEEVNKEIKKVTMFGEVYKIESLTKRVAICFNNISRMEKESAECNYQALKAQSALEFQAEQLKVYLKEDKIKAEPKKEAKEEDKK